MTTKASIFEKTYKDYIAQVAEIDFKPIEQKLGVHAEGNDVTIPLFGKSHKVLEKLHEEGHRIRHLKRVAKVAPLYSIEARSSDPGIAIPVMKKDRNLSWTWTAILSQNSVQKKCVSISFLN